VLGALTGLYARLPTNPEVTDVDTGQESVVHVDVAGLDPDTVAPVGIIMADAKPSTSD